MLVLAIFLLNQMHGINEHALQSAMHQMAQQTPNEQRYVEILELVCIA